MQREYDTLKKTHSDFVHMHNETVADFTLKVTVLDAEISAHLGVIEEQRVTIEKLRLELAATQKQRDEQTERANGLERKLVLANKEIEEKKKEIAILQKAQKELETLMEAVSSGRLSSGRPLLISYSNLTLVDAHLSSPPSYTRRTVPRVEGREGAGGEGAQGG